MGAVLIPGLPSCSLANNCREVARYNWRRLKDYYPCFCSWNVRRRYLLVPGFVPREQQQPPGRSHGSHRKNIRLYAMQAIV